MNFKKSQNSSTLLTEDQDKKEEYEIFVHSGHLSPKFNFLRSSLEGQSVRNVKEKVLSMSGLSKCNLHEYQMWVANKKGQPKEEFPGHFISH